MLIDDALRPALAAAQEELRASRASVKWVEPQNLHFTLKFLGDVAEERTEAVTEALREVARRTPPFAGHVAGVGVFPSLSRPRVVWAGMTAGAEELAGLASEVEEALVPLGFERERRAFTPHLTLGRVKSVVNVSNLAEAVQRHAEADFGPLRVDAVYLMRSDLRPSGPVYSPLAELWLRGVA